MSKDELDFPSSHPVYSEPQPSSDGLDLGHVTAALRDNRGTIYAIAAVVFICVLLSTAMSQMEFQSDGRLYLGELDDKGNQKAEDFLSSKQGDVYNEIEILRSISHVRRAILQTGLNVSIKPEGWNAPRYWRWLASGRDPALLDVADRELSSIETKLGGATRDAKTFTIEFTTDTHYSVSAKRGPKLGEGDLGKPTVLRDLELTLVPGKLQRPRGGIRYDLTVFPLEETVENVLRNLEVMTAAKGSTAADPVKVLTLAFSSQSPRKAAAFLERLMLVYLEERQAWKTEDATAAERFVTEQLNGIQRSLHDTDEKLAEFRTQHEPVVQSSQAETVVAQLGNYEQQRIAASLQASGLRTLQQKLAMRDPPAEAYLVGDEQDPMLQNLAQTLSLSQQRLVELDTKFYENAPDVMQQREQVKRQLSTIRSYVSNRLARANQQVAALDAVIKQYETKLRSVPGAELGLAQIGRDNDVYSRMYSLLLERQQQAAIVKASTVSKNRILDMPQTPRKEYSPKLWLRLATAMLGFLLGIVVVLAKALTSKSLRTESDVRSLMGWTSVFAHIPRQGRGGLLAPRSAPAPHAFDLLSGAKEDFGFAEAFRTLRTNLYFALTHEHGKVILITSPSHGDGKTTTTMCLAALLAADGKCVLTIDADLRKPTHHLITGNRADPGLRGILLGAPEASAIHCVGVRTGVFDSMGAGSGGRPESLSNQRLSNLLIRARHHYDYILVDSPAFPMVSDALILAHQADFVLSVLRIGNTPRRVAEEHMRGLVTRTKGHAVVVNGSDVLNVYGYPADAVWHNSFGDRVLPADAGDHRRRT